MTESYLSFNDTITVEVSGVKYDCDVSAQAVYRYWPGTMYRGNGDPGDPPEDDLDITSMTVESCKESESGQQLMVTPDDIKDACREFLAEMDIDLWSE